MSPRQSPHLFGCLWTFGVALAADLMPRLSFLAGDSRRIISPFHHKGFQNYDTFLPSKDGTILYVGARDAILALDISNASSISLKRELLWGPTPTKRDECVFKKKSNETECFNFLRVLVQLNETHLYACGTYAFSPSCAYVDLKTFTLVTDANGKPLLLEGKGLCPFDPQHQNTAILVDGELYTGTRNNFQGNEAIIIRNLGSRAVLKTDNWLHDDATFVASINIPIPPDDDKVYFFFRETAKEFDFFEKLTISRVARVCKNDIGGEKILQRKWTTFLKAQLSCARQGQFPYTAIQHVFAVPQTGGGTVFYGVFASQWQVGNLESSAVCAFTLDAVKKAFDGKYKELNKDCSQWMTYNGPAMDPRPGSCSVGPSADKALTFMKDHYLMDEKIGPIQNRPLLVKEKVKYTRIVVHQTQSALGNPYNVLFLGTDKGALHKAVVVGSEAHIIEEIQLFEKPEAVQNLLFSPEKGILYVGYSRGVLQVPLANCSIYTTCADCILARDPYCGWDGQKCRDVRGATANRHELVQDIETGKPEIGCQRRGAKGRVMPRSRNDSDGSLIKNLTVQFNTMVRLPCPQASALANYSWSYPEGKAAEGLIVEDDKTLVIIVQKDTLGTYECWARENGYYQPVVRYELRPPGHFGSTAAASGSDMDGEGPEGPTGEHRSYWAQFVTVTVLLSLTLAVGAALAFFSYHDKLKERRKVQGCNSLPDASKACSGPEKVPLNGSQGSEYPRQDPCPKASKNAKTCCVEVGGPFQDTDADNNRLDSGPAGGEDSKRAVAGI